MRVSEALNRAQTERIEESRRAVEELHALVTEGDTVEVFREFCECVTVIIGHKRAEIPKSLLQCINELMKRLKQTREGRNFVQNTIKHLARGLDAKLKHVRVNSLEILRGSMEGVETVSPRLWSAVKAKIAEKLFDKEAGVRARAVYIVAKYQETYLDGGLPFYKLLKDVMKYDSAAEVRKSALQMIAVNRSTLRAIITRASDVDEGVRMAFVATKLSSVPLEQLTQEERHALLRVLEEERTESIRAKFVQKMYTVLEEVYECKYVLLVDAFYIENKNNSALERVLRELMKEYEYASGFRDDFLAEVTAAELFLMRVSLEHVDKERGRDEIALPEIEVLLKSIVDTGVVLVRDEEYSGSVTHTLFALLEYYDVFQAREREVIGKAAVYILAQEKEVIKEVIESVCRMVVKAYSGVSNEKVYTKMLCTGSVRTQMLCALYLVKHAQEKCKQTERVWKIIEERVQYGIDSTDEEIKRIGIELTVLMCVAKNTIDAHTVEKLKVIAEQSSTEQSSIEEESNKKKASRSSVAEDAYCALVDICIVFRAHREIYEWVHAQLRVVRGTIADRTVTKLLLSEVPNEEEAEVMISAVVQRYYTEETSEEDAQYLHVFFHEYFRKKHWMIFSTYRAVIGKVKHWKVLNDQIVYWFEAREDTTYRTSDLLLLTLSSALKAIREHEDAHIKDKKECLVRYLDMLGKVACLEYVLDNEADKKKALDLASALSKHVVKILPDSDTVKNLLFAIISTE